MNGKSGSAMVAGIVGAVVLVVLIVIPVFMGIGYKNTEVELRNQCSAQQDANKIIYDKVWKVIKQKAQITDKYAADFKGIYVGLMEARYGADKGSNPAFKWIKEQNPDFSDKMYLNLADAIEGNRAEFAMVQKRLRDIKRVHDNLIMTIPSKWFLGGAEPLEVQLVLSTQTDKAFETVKEDNVDLF